jgi:thymidylate kinase
VVGGDGSGKSSTVAALNTTFSRYFPTHIVHMGKPRHSRTGRLLKKTVRRLSRAGGESPSALPAWADFDSLGFPGHAFFIWHMLTTRYRHQEYQLARRASAGGALVICDRFPLEEISLMDSPRGQLVPGLQRRPIARWLATREADYYDRIARPDLLIVLRVDPEVAVGRRGEDGAEFVRRRAEEVWAHDWSSHPAAVIDSSQPQRVVLSEAHAAVWRAL